MDERRTFLDGLLRLVRPDVPAEAPAGAVIEAAHVRYHHRIPTRGYRRFGRYALVLVTEGTGRYTDKHQRTEVSAGDLLLVLPEHRHTYEPSPPAWSEMYLVFDGPVFDALRRSEVLSPHRAVTRTGDPVPWMRRLRYVIEPSAPTMQAGRLVALLTEVLSTPDSTGASEQQRVRDAQHLLAAEPHLRVDLRAVAERVGVSYAVFRKGFAAVTGESPGRYRTARVMDRACELLADGRYADHEIAVALGFTDPCHFSRRFKQVVGRSPSAFRRGLLHRR